MPMTEAAIDSGFMQDLYALFGRRATRSNASVEHACLLQALCPLVMGWGLGDGVGWVFGGA
jgi:hypothetical protein